MVEDARTLSRIADHAQLGAWEIFFRFVLGVIFALAALGKVIDVQVFAKTISWLIPGAASPQWMNVGLAAVVVAWEVFLAVWLLSTKADSRILWCVAGTLVAFTLVLVRIWGDPLAPNCGCLSLLKIASRTNHEAGAGVVRNIALLVIVGWLLWNALRHRDLEPAPR